MNTHNLKILLLPMLAFAAVGNIAAQNLYWNPPSGTSWSTTNVNWSTTEVDPASLAWPGGSGVSNTAAFGGAGGSVSVEENLSAGGLRFNSDGYTISASGARTLTLTGTNPLINVDTGKTATLGANVQILSSNKIFTKTGEGTLDITSGLSLFGSGAAADGSRLVVQEGTLKISGSALVNTYTMVNVAGGASMLVGGSGVSIGGLSGTGSVHGTTATILQFRGRYGAYSITNFNFGGVISGDLQLEILNGAQEQILSGSEANTFTGAMTIRTGKIVLAKDDGVTAMSGSQVHLGGAVAAELRLDANHQIADATDFVFRASSAGKATFNLNGHSETLGNLVVNTRTGLSIIDYGINDLAQILTFQSLSAPGVLNITNFQIGLDELRFINDPTAQLGNVFINDQATYATDFGTYWGVVPEPSTLLLLMMGFLFVLWRPRRRLSRFGRLG